MVVGGRGLVVRNPHAAHPPQCVQGFEHFGHAFGYLRGRKRAAVGGARLYRAEERVREVRFLQADDEVRVALVVQQGGGEQGLRVRRQGQGGKAVGFGEERCVFHGNRCVVGCSVERPSACSINERVASGGATCVQVQRAVGVHDPRGTHGRRARA